MNNEAIKKVNDYLWEIPQTGKMRVPARIYATEKMMKNILADEAPLQAANVAHLPGIVTASMAMPDIHWGYGFPIGGVAAFDLNDGVVSPGGVGYDINCGVRLMASQLTREEIMPRLHDLVNALFGAIPSGVGSSGALNVSDKELKTIATQGARWAVSRGFGDADDLDRIEENGRIPDSDADQVSIRAWKRGRDQVGTLGSGNHFLEIGCVSEIYDRTAANVFGLFPEQVTLLIHCGSRGLGHQICDDHLAVMDKAARKYGIELPDRQLACAPVNSEEGRAYLAAMRCAVNYAFANRQVIAHEAEETLAKTLHKSPGDIGLATVYEVAHNIAKIETHLVEGVERRLCVHRKGATRAFAPGNNEVPAAYRECGQPVLAPGDMGRYSYVLAGTQKAMLETFGSACHGAGRAMSRHKAMRAARGRDIIAELAEKGTIVKGQSRQTMAEEMPEAYKDVSDVVDACVMAGIANKVALIKPLGCIKG